MTNSQKLRETMGLMFHHFHGVGHPESQGSISVETFRQILTHVGLENILSAHTWMERYKTGKLTQNNELYPKVVRGVKSRGYLVVKLLCLNPVFELYTFYHFPKLPESSQPAPVVLRTQTQLEHHAQHPLSA